MRAPASASAPCRAAARARASRETPGALGPRGPACERGTGRRRRRRRLLLATAKLCSRWRMPSTEPGSLYTGACQHLSFSGRFGGRRVAACAAVWRACERTRPVIDAELTRKSSAPSVHAELEVPGGRRVMQGAIWQVQRARRGPLASRLAVPASRTWLWPLAPTGCMYASGKGLRGAQVRQHGQAACQQPPRVNSPPNSQDCVV